MTITTETETTTTTSRKSRFARTGEEEKREKESNAIAALLQAACLKTWKAARKGCNRDSYALAGENNRKVRRWRASLLSSPHLSLSLSFLSTKVCSYMYVRICTRLLDRGEEKVPFLSNFVYE